MGFIPGCERERRGGRERGRGRGRGRGNELLSNEAVKVFLGEASKVKPEEKFDEHFNKTILFYYFIFYLLF
jgi:hypothetical protein